MTREFLETVIEKSYEKHGKKAEKSTYIISQQGNEFFIAINKEEPYLRLDTFHTLLQEIQLKLMFERIMTTPLGFDGNFFLMKANEC